VRFGDPEALVRCCGSTLIDPALLPVAEGRLADVALDWMTTRRFAVMAAKGYPGAYAKGSEIKGLQQAGADPNVQIFHAGTRRDGARILADGGRVLGVTARGGTIADAKARAYAAIDKIDWRSGFFRRDIGWRALPRKT
jgi:phosphoribosylamine--glycine ligase